MAHYTLKNLKEDSIRVYNNMITVYPQHNTEEKVRFSDVATFNGCFSSNNGTLAFVYDSILYATPVTRRAFRALSEAGFRERYFYVPFSNWDYPKKEKKRWETLKQVQNHLQKEEFIQDCIAYCEEHGIGALDEDTLLRCYVMPTKGVQVKHIRYATTYFPVINQKYFDCTVPDRIGKFCYNNGRVVFVYRDGTTMVTRGYWIIGLLKSAGYKEGSLFVPFSNGEQIVDLAQRAAWERITK